MNDIQIFNNPDFGEIRTVVIDGEPWLVGVDVARALGYKKPTGAVTTNVDVGDTLRKGVSDSNNHTQQAIVINESGLYALIFGSKLESAKKFKKWVTSEVLPSLRKTGSYSTQKQLPMTTDEKIQLIAQGYTEVREEIKSVRDDLEALKMDLPILPIEADRISNAARAKGVDVMGGKISTAYKSKSIRQNVYTDIYGSLKRQFGITGTYKKLKRSQCDMAVEIIQNYQLPMYLKEMIDKENGKRN